MVYELAALPVQRTQWESREATGKCQSTAMHVYIINLDGATKRWEFVSKSFAATGLPYSRVPGVLGRELTLPHPQYRPLQFAVRHGQRTNLSAVGCYLSHLKCLQWFLESDHSHALIAEDDAQPVTNLGEIVDRALAYQSTWDVLRLCGYHDPHPREYARLDERYHLCVCLTRLCGTGAYVVNRKAAQELLQQLDPMTLPIDHAIDREWVYGLRAAAVMPLPIKQLGHRFISQCAENRDHKLPWYQRYWTVLPYRAWNETSRVFHRRRQLASVRRLAGWETPSDMVSQQQAVA